MRSWMLSLSGAAALAGCGSSPDVDLKNADQEKVAQAVRQSDANLTLRPGRWSASSTIQEFNAPGMPPEMAAQMKGMIGGAEAEVSCLTPEEAKHPKEEFFSRDNKECRYDHFQLAGGKIDMKMHCGEGRKRQVVAMTGTYSPDAYSTTLTMTPEPGSAEAVTMRLKVDAKRVGQCDGTEA